VTVKNGYSAKIKFISKIEVIIHSILVHGLKPDGNEGPRSKDTTFAKVSNFGKDLGSKLEIFIAVGF
jgi:hypothetical protein